MGRDAEHCTTWTLGWLSKREDGSWVPSGPRRPQVVAKRAEGALGHEDAAIGAWMTRSMVNRSIVDQWCVLFVAN